MVREILHVQVGQCGNQVSSSFWSAVCKEHNLGAENSWADVLKNEAGQVTGHDPKSAMYNDVDGDGVPDRHEKIDVFFRQAKDHDNWWLKTFTPRCILVDLEPGTLDVIKESPLKSLFAKSNMKFGSNGAGNNWAKGHYTEGAEIVEDVIDIIQKEAEKADMVQGFQLFHSLGGGTGSGMGTLLLLKIRDAYPDKITCTYSVFPSPKVSDTVVEPYNAVLSSHQLLENSDETFIVDNEALYNIMHNVLKKQSVEYKVLNKLIAKVTCGVTASIRFPGLLNGDLRKLGVNLVPFPRLHFFLVSYAPLESSDAASKNTVKVKDLTVQVQSARNFYSNVKADDGKYLAVALTFRGKEKKKDEKKKKATGGLSTKEVDDAVKQFQKQGAEANAFTDWIPNNIKSGIVTIPDTDAQLSATSVGNTTALKGIFQRLATQFGAMYRRKAFLHWYKGEGMDEMEFQEADKNVRDLITEYQDKQDASFEEEEQDDDDSADN